MPTRLPSDSHATIVAVAERSIVGVDLGGTNVRARAFSRDGAPLSDLASTSSRATEGLDAVAEAISSVVRACASNLDAAPERIGIAAPGHIDGETGTVRWAPNFGVLVEGVFQNWIDVPLGEAVAARLGAEVVMGNDANLAALGEYRYGTGRNAAKGLVLFTLGTGIGGGVVLSPSCVQGEAKGSLVLVGGNGGGGELGHLVVREGGLDCSAGSYGAVEAYCQRDAIVRRAVYGLQRGRKSSLGEAIGNDLSRVTPKLIAEGADGGDELCQEVLAEVGQVLGVAMGNAINIFAPEVVAVGGQIALAGEWILAPARRAARSVAIPSLFEFATIVQGERIDDAGVLGAAALAMG